MTIQTIIASQYRASLTMLLGAVEACPADLWRGTADRNPFWRIVYHTLYYAHLYLQQSEDDFVPWTHHRPGYNRFDDIDASISPYSVDEMRAYGRQVFEMVDTAVGRLDLSSPESGFSWYQMSKLEHQFVSIRHIQHHTGQLADRLRHAADTGLRWVRDGSQR